MSDEINYDPDIVKLILIDWPDGAWSEEIETAIREDLWNVRANGLNKHEDLLYHDFNSSSGWTKPSILVCGNGEGFEVVYCGEEDLA